MPRLRCSERDVTKGKRGGRLEEEDKRQGRVEKLSNEAAKKVWAEPHP